MLFMKSLLCKFGDLEIWKDGEVLYALYDAGSHQVMMRKDEITEGDASFACRGEKEAGQMLLALQARLLDAGSDPYSSNTGCGYGGKESH
jgi:hypothetical protein